MRTENELVAEYRRIRGDYAYDPDIMNADDERVARIKEIIDTKLSTEDKTMLLLYVDCMSYRKLGEKMKLSHMTVYKEIRRIKGIILKEYGKNLH